MKVFIFGAGASKGSQNTISDSKFVAPLMDELFDNKYNEYFNELGFSINDIGNIRDSIHKGEHLEEILVKKWDLIKNYKSEQKIFAEKTNFGRLALYLWKLLQKVSTTYEGNNKYTRLLQIIKDRDEDFGLINFNYDTLLDQAYIDVFGIRLGGSLEAYSLNNYIKPHGSINWLLQKRKNEPSVPEEILQDIKVRYQISSSGMFNGPNLLLNNVFVINPTHKDINDGSFISHIKFNGDYFYPLIFIPLLKKQYDFVHNFNERVISEGKRILSLADEIFIIGYKAKDDIIKDLFLNVNENTKLNVVSISDPEEIANRILTWKPKLKKNFVQKLDFRSFLNYFTSW
jgi:hypothetical protein